MHQARAEDAVEFGERLRRGDETVFAAIPSESTTADRRSLLACQLAVRRHHGTYVYLEIGSHLGGSLQPHVLDPACTVAHSIDPRPGVQPDARGSRFAYPGNSTARMMARLAELGDASKVRCHDASSADVEVAALAPAPQLCFIDGEHTDAAVQADFALCQQLLTRPGLLVFHDAHIVYNGLAAIVRGLEQADAPFRACVLPDSLFVIALGTPSLLDDPGLSELQRLSYRSYLGSLQQLDPYRRFANHWLFRAWRRLRAIGG